MNRIHTFVSSCDDCPACVYETGGRYSCERAEYRRFAEKGKSEPPGWCPLPVYTPPPEPAAAQPTPCTWTQSRDPSMPDTYTATCGVVWTFNDGGPAENGMVFCPGCARKVTKGGSS
jgi:hypothetical protein